MQAQGLAAFRLAAVAAYPEEREKRPGNIQPCGLAASYGHILRFWLHGMKGVGTGRRAELKALRPFA